MRVLLDTNILIHREAATVIREDIGILFRWLDRLRHEKWIHHLSVKEIGGHRDPKIAASFKIKLRSYQLIETDPAETPEIAALRENDRSPNDVIDTSLLAVLAANRVDVLITEDAGIHRKAQALNIEDSVLTIEAFIDRAVIENPDLADYKVLSARRRKFGHVNLNDPFFDTFKADYPGFSDWFNRKAEEIAYVCTGDADKVLAFLYLKSEDETERYPAISPSFVPKRRLKVGTMKVDYLGVRLGERFMKVIFDNAVLREVDEIYVTVFPDSAERQRLINLFLEWGFVQHGVCNSTGKEEMVLTRSMRPASLVGDPKLYYPFMNSNSRKFIVPIYPEYHTELLPDALLNNEAATDYLQDKPNRNAIRKVYVSRSMNRTLVQGDLIVFYRTKSRSSPAFYTSVATTVGVVFRTHNRIPDLETLIKVCRKRSVFSDEQLRAVWEWNPSNPPYAVEFLFVQAFGRRPNLKELTEGGIIAVAPRGFEPLTDAAFTSLLRMADANTRLVVG